MLDKQREEEKEEKVEEEKMQRNIYLTFPANETDVIYCESVLYDWHKVINIINLNTLSILRYLCFLL